MTRWYGCMHGMARPPRANFISVLCLAWPDGTTELFEGKVYGHRCVAAARDQWFRL